MNSWLFCSIFNKQTDSNLQLVIQQYIELVSNVQLIIQQNSQLPAVQLVIQQYIELPTIAQCTAGYLQYIQ